WLGRTVLVRRRMNRFLWRGADSVRGWLRASCARVVVALAQIQDEERLQGSVGEIGVFEGRLFILLKLSCGPGEKSFAIDLFDTLHPTDGGPQACSKEQFLANVARWTGSADDVVTFASRSQAIAPGEILNHCKPARLLSVDGEHSEEAVLADLKLAEALTSQDGVVLVDDYFNPSWPAVAAGVIRYLQTEEALLRPFAI